MLLITTLDEEGINFKKLDYDDNRINDLEACTIDSSGNCYQYQYSPPKEDVTFNITLDSTYDELRLVFYKTTINSTYQSLYDINNRATLAQTNNHKDFTYKIDKGKLFESDKIEFYASKNGIRAQSNKLDFLFW